MTHTESRPQDTAVLLRSAVFSILAEAYNSGDNPSPGAVESLLELRLGFKPKYLSHIGAAMIDSIGIPVNEIGVVIELCDMSPGLGYASALALTDRDGTKEIASFAFRSTDSPECIKRVLSASLEKKPGKCVIIRKVLGPEELEKTKDFIKMLQDSTNGMIVSAVKGILATAPLNDSNGIKWSALISTT